MPGMATVCRWLNERPSFREQYARAREMQADVIAEETFEIADDGRNDWMEVETQKGSYIKLNDEAVSRSRLRLDQRKWWLSKLAPKKYGEKLEVEHSGEMDVRVVIGGNAANS